MKNQSIRVSILVPSLTVLIVGIALMIVTVGLLSVNSSDRLTNQLLEARVSEYTNAFQIFNGEAYGLLKSTAPVVSKYTEPDFVRDTATPRDDVISVLTDILLANENVYAVWTGWEPNSFDGRDSEYVSTAHSDRGGRFVPYIYRDGAGGVVVEPLTGYDDPASGDYYLGARNSGNPYITDPYDYPLADGSSTLMYSIAMPVFRDGTVAGVVGLDIDISSLQDIMNAGSILTDGQLFTVSPSGLITTIRNQEYIMKDFSESWLGGFGGEVQAALSNGSNFNVSGDSEENGGAIRLLGEVTVVGGTGRNWLIGGIVPEDTSRASSMELLRFIIGIGTAVVLIVGLTVFFIVRMRLKELPGLTDAALAMTNGDARPINRLSASIDGVPTRNEVTELKSAFLGLAGRMKEQSEIMAGIAVEVASGSKQIADGAQVLAQGSIEQAEAVSDLSHAIGMVSDKTKENTGIAMDASRLSNEIRLGAEAGSEQMERMMQAVMEINDASSEIGKVIKVIDDIAFQTNILALNAAVEAARAGSHGKGFAVVADEVRSLAAKSAIAARDTNSLIEDSMKKADSGLKIATDTSESLKGIVTGINQSAAIIEQIARSSGEQSTAIESINSGIEQVAGVVRQNSATAQESAAASQQMSSQSVLLADTVERFKLRDGAGDVTYSRTGQPIAGQPLAGQPLISDKGINAA